MTDKDKLNEERRDAICKKEWDEIQYWIKEWMLGVGTNHMVVTAISADDTSSTVIYYLEMGDAIIVQADYSAEDPEESIKWMTLDKKVIERLAANHTIRKLGKKEEAK